MHLDLEKYSGEWYELGHYPANSTCCDNAVLMYRRIKDGLKLVNTCIHNGKATKTFIAFAKPTETPGLLLIQRDGHGVGFYNVLWTDYNNFAIVSDNSQKRMWLLTRHREISQAELSLLRKKVEELGFNPREVKLSKGGYIK
jgi:lipocalin